MFDSNFSHSSKTDLDDKVSNQLVLELLHDFDTIMHLNPDFKAARPAQSPPKGVPVPQGAAVYDCEDALTFIPKKLWDGGVWYTAIFAQQQDGCDITIKAPGGFNSINKWRLQMDREGRKCISIVSDAKCSKTFAGFVKKFLENSHQTQQRRFREVLGSQMGGVGGGSRPGMNNRRRSSWG